MKCTKGALTEGNDKGKVGGNTKNITDIVSIFFSGRKSVLKKAVFNSLIVGHRSKTVIFQELETFTYTSVCAHIQCMDIFKKSIN